jgi:hypothetical protein
MPKAVAIDGANLCQSHRVLGFDEIHYGRLIGYLRHAVGKDIPVSLCRATIRPEFCGLDHQLFRDMKKAGIVPVGAKAFRNEDDSLVKKWVCEAMSDPLISEVHLLSGDGEIIHHTLTLARLCGIKKRICDFYIVSTKAPGHDGHPQIGRESLREINACSCAHFLDLQTFLPRVAYTNQARH